MKNILYIHGYGSDKDSYTGNTLKKLFPEHHWVLETFDLVNFTECYKHIQRVLEDEKIDIIVSSSLGSIYNLFIPKDEKTGRMADKIFINPCCFPSKELPKLPQGTVIPQNALKICETMERNIYELNHDNTADKIFGIFSKNDELFQYHDFFASRYGNADSRNAAVSNCIWVDGRHAHLDAEVLLNAFNQAFVYFQQQEELKSLI